MLEVSFKTKGNDYCMKMRKYKEAMYHYKEPARIYTNLYNFRDVMIAYEIIANVKKLLNYTTKRMYL
ncbi:hypothetical protein SAMN02787100_1821 [Chryseobacterium sp. OV279]|nr:hypothetical protein SAMN02787100_1821 [Chryseobacterium sp. OV279]